jgi:hypothetical protein
MKQFYFHSLSTILCLLVVLVLIVAVAVLFVIVQVEMMKHIVKGKFL